MASFTIKRTIAAPPETVFAALTDHRGYADYTPIRKAELEQEGDPAPNGVGAIRRLHMFGPPIREQVVEYEPSTKFVYKLLSGAPLKDHVGTVTLEPNGPGTLMIYTVDTTPTLPFGGGLAVAISKRAVTQLADGVVKESERRG